MFGRWIGSVETFKNVPNCEDNNMIILNTSCLGKRNYKHGMIEQQEKCSTLRSYILFKLRKRNPVEKQRKRWPSVAWESNNLWRRLTWEVTRKNTDFKAFTKLRFILQRSTEDHKAILETRKPMYAGDRVIISGFLILITKAYFERWHGFSVPSRNS